MYAFVVSFSRFSQILVKNASFSYVPIYDDHIYSPKKQQDSSSVCSLVCLLICNNENG